LDVSLASAAGIPARYFLIALGVDAARNGAN